MAGDTAMTYATPDQMPDWFQLSPSTATRTPCFKEFKEFKAGISTFILCFRHTQSIDYPKHHEDHHHVPGAFFWSLSTASTVVPVLRDSSST